MNCLEFRRRLLIDPHDHTAAFLRHKQECVPCALETERIETLDEQIDRAVKVDIPEGLASRIILKQSFEKHPKTRASLSLALAASVLFAVSVIGWLGYRWPISDSVDGYTALQTAVMEHIDDELAYLQVDYDVSPQAVRMFLKNIGADLRKDLSQRVRYAGNCSIRRNTGAHLVFTGTKGPITVLIMPKERLIEPIAVKSPYFDGVILPLARGSMAIIGEEGEPLQQTADVLRRDLDWI